MRMWMRITNHILQVSYHKNGRLTEIIRKSLRGHETRGISAERLSLCQRLIQQHTVITTHSLTPEIALHLITPECSLWSAPVSDVPFRDPFWAFYWPGGQALSRFVLDNPATVLKQIVMDVGSGCGASAIAAVKSGASHVIANDVDSVAGMAIDLNCDLNNVRVQFSEDNYVGVDLDIVDCILIGDMFYDEEFADHLMQWIQSLKRKGKCIFLGDPGRLAFMKYKRSFECVAEYKLVQDSLSPGLPYVSVWTVK